MTDRLDDRSDDREALVGGGEPGVVAGPPSVGRRGFMGRALAALGVAAMPLAPILARCRGEVVVERTRWFFEARGFQWVKYSTPDFGFLGYWWRRIGDGGLYYNVKRTGEHLVMVERRYGGPGSYRVSTVMGYTPEEVERLVHFARTGGRVLPTSVRFHR